MKPVLAIVGRPNVGKSTLFNQLTQSRDALVADIPGLTRDRQYGEGRLGDKPFLVIDTGGIGEESSIVDELMAKQSVLAAEEADAILFVVDGRAGAMPGDFSITKHLRQLQKPVYCIVNKTDGLEPDLAIADFYQLGFSDVIAVAASHGRGVTSMIEAVLETFPESESEEEKPAGIRVAIVGRPNVGKSTLVNRMLGEERVVVCDLPGTTRDSIYVPMIRDDEHFVLIDTAGVRRRARVKETIEKFSVIKTLQSIEEAQVVIMMLDAQAGISDQDLHLLGFILDAGKSIVIAVNKWDGLSMETKEDVKSEMDRRLTFTDFAEMYFISARHGTNVGHLFKAVKKAYDSATTPHSTAELTEILQTATQEHQPPLVRGRRIKLRYAHPGGYNPPIIVIHGNQTERLPDSYKRYLVNKYRKVLGLVGTPIRLECRSSENPYADKRETLTPRQKRTKQKAERKGKLKRD